MYAVYKIGSYYNDKTHVKLGEAKTIREAEAIARAYRAPKTTPSGKIILSLPEKCFIDFRQI